MKTEHDARFLTTQWTAMMGSSGSSSDSAASGLVRLCEAYHRPVYTFIRHQTRDPEQARDLCQGFFEMLVTTRFYERADRQKGRFRSYLLAAVKNYLHEEHRTRTRLKRGGDAMHFSLDLDEAEQHFRGELGTEVPDETLFDHQWAVTVFERVWKMLRAEYEEAGHIDRFEAIHPLLTNPAAQTSYTDLGPQLGLSENGVKTIVHRMKARFREIFRTVVGQLVEHPDQVDEEISYLIQATARDPWR